MGKKHNNSSIICDYHIAHEIEPIENVTLISTLFFSSVFEFIQLIGSEAA